MHSVFDLLFTEIVPFLLLLVLSDRVVILLVGWHGCAQMHLAEALLHDLVVERALVELWLPKVADERSLALPLSLEDVSLADLRRGWTQELVQGCLDVVLGDDALQLRNEVGVQLSAVVALLLGRVAIVDSDLLIRVVQLPRLPLVLVVEVDDEERVLEVDEEVAHVRLLVRLLVVLDDVQGRVSALVLLVDLVLELLLGVSAWDVFDAEVRSKIFPLHDSLDIHWLAVIRPRRLRVCRARILRPRRTLGLGAALLVRVGRLSALIVDRELVVAVVVSAEEVEADLGVGAVKVLRLGRLHVVADAEGARLDWVLQGANHPWRLV